MADREGSALDVLLFGKGDGEVLVDVKCFRGDRDDVSAADIAREVHEGIMQHKMNTGLASTKAPSLGVSRIDVAEFVMGLPVAA